ncbi:MAG: endonuclease VII domain-containing protein [Jatrophihabitans sp.]|uniref:endonuclease VII domain-containing protein n=1 Tax=Jatrophihabitans sp. TaxID=1932789 RepID=UPI003F8015BE
MSEAPEKKFCPDCQEEKPASAFTRDSRRRDGLAFYCTLCRRARDEASRRKRLSPRKLKQRPRDLRVPDGHRWCPDCEQVKPQDQFPRNRSTTDGYGSYCKPCFNIRTKVSVERHGGNRNYQLRRRYGITVEHFDTMFAEQHGLCAICRAAPAEHVDHDHVTGRVRALLCFNCNGALGQFRDRPDLMLAAIEYLRRHSEQPLAELPPYSLLLGLDGGFDETNRPEPPGTPGGPDDVCAA